MTVKQPMAERLNVGGDVIDVRVDSTASDGTVLAYDLVISPGGGPPHLHRHPAVEVVRVEDGELTVYLGDAGGIDRRPAHRGEVVCIAADREHTFRNESSATVRAFVILTPGDEMEHFARSAAALGAEATPARVAELAADFGIEITRPLEPPA